MELTNDQRGCIKVIKTITNLLYISSFWPFHLSLQGPNQVLAPEAKALTSKAKAAIYRS